MCINHLTESMSASEKQKIRTEVLQEWRRGHECNRNMKLYYGGDIPFKFNCNRRIITY